jgi:hypothetical protein
MKTKLNSFEEAVIKKLLARKVIHKHHLRLPTLLRCGWKPHEKGFVKQAVKSLIKKGFIVWAKKDKKALTLNKFKLTEILKRSD